MQISSVRIRRLSNARLKGVASFVVDGVFLIRGVRIIQGEHRLFVAMPSRRRRNGSYEDVAHPTNATCREEVEAAVLTAYFDGYGPLAGCGVRVIPPAGPAYRHGFEELDWPWESRDAAESTHAGRPTTGARRTQGAVGRGLDTGVERSTVLSSNHRRLGMVEDRP